MPDWSMVRSKLAEATGERFDSFRISRVGGGGTSVSAVIETEKSRYFVKQNNSDSLDMFAAEAEGLKALAATRTVRVPAPICWGTGTGIAFLVLEWLDLSFGVRRNESQLGRRLAAMHRTTQSQFGWHRDNTIGLTPQINDYSSDWKEFFRDRRLGFQFALAWRRGYSSLRASGEYLLSHLDRFFEDHTPEASLLHGDLWAGNTGETAAGEPVIFDPALYFGDRETDLAMTELFGGFSESFCRSYGEAWPLPAGYETRKTLYNLYHVLNHLNLFGSSYLRQAEWMIGRLLADIR
jgi:protein-ribulosamine 3-kinase